MLKIVASLTDDSRGFIYNCNILIMQATDHNINISMSIAIKPNVLSGVMVSVIIPSVVMLSVVRLEDTSACNSSQLILIIILPPQKSGANPFSRINTFQPIQNAPMSIMKL
jgi:hypothetical protein